MLAELFNLKFSNAYLEDPAVSLRDPATWAALGVGPETESGVTVTHSSAITYAPVYQSVSLISGDVASALPHVFKRMPDDDREIDYGHPANWLISEQANDEQNAFDFWRAMMVHALLWTNGYAYIRQNRGSMSELLLLLPDRTRPERLTYQTALDATGSSDMATFMAGTLVYVTEVNGKLETLLPSQVLHIKGMSLDGTRGADLVMQAREAWGLGLAAQGFAARFFKNGGRVGGILEIPHGFKKPAADALEEGFRRSYENKDANFRTVILREGAKFHEAQKSPEESQLTEARETDVRMVARFFNLPPHKLGIPGSVSYNSHEQGEIAYKNGCLRHWFSAIRYESQAKLLSENQRRKRTHFIDHNTSKLIETDEKTKNEVLEIQRRNEVISADDWRRKINLNKRPDGKGGEYINPNTKSAPVAGQSPKESAARNEARLLVVDAVGRGLRRVGAQARAAARSPAKYIAWLDALAVDDLRDTAAAPLRVWLALCDAPTGDGDGMVDELYASLRAALASLADPPHKADELETNVDRELKKLEAGIAGVINQWEARYA